MKKLYQSPWWFQWSPFWMQYEMLPCILIVAIISWTSVQSSPPTVLPTSTATTTTNSAPFPTEVLVEHSDSSSVVLLQRENAFLKAEVANLIRSNQNLQNRLKIEQGTSESHIRTPASKETQLHRKRK